VGSTLEGSSLKRKVYYSRLQYFDFNLEAWVPRFKGVHQRKHPLRPQKGIQQIPKGIQQIPWGNFFHICVA